MQLSKALAYTPAFFNSDQLATFRDRTSSFLNSISPFNTRADRRNPYPTTVIVNTVRFSNLPRPTPDMRSFSDMSNGSHSIGSHTIDSHSFDQHFDQNINSHMAQANRDNLSTSSHKRLKREWDTFWKEGISVPRGMHRRHIVMAKVMKQCIKAMREWAVKQNQIEALKGCYQHFLNQFNDAEGLSERHGESSNPSPLTMSDKNHNENSDENNVSDLDIDTLEQAVFKRLHNLRFNIFLGDGYINQAISSVADIIANTEEETIHSINQATTKAQVVTRTHQWVTDRLESDKAYKYPEYKAARDEIISNVKTVLLPSSECVEKSTLDELKTDMKERIFSLYDSLAADISNASNEALKVWQNRNILPLQADLERISHQPNLSDLQSTLNHIVQLEREGSLLFHFPLNDLNDFKDHPDIVSKFTGMITEGWDATH